MECTKLHVTFGASVAIIIVKGSLDDVEKTLTESYGLARFDMAPMIDAENVDRNYIGALEQILVNTAHVTHCVRMSPVMMPTHNGGI